MLKLPTAVLEAMRDAAESLMTDTCKIEVRSNSVGEYGEPLEAYETVASSVVCRVTTLGSRFKEAAEQVGGREAIVDAYRLICPAGTPLAVDQRVTLTSTGERWQVVDLITARTDEVDRQAAIVRAQ